MYRFKFQNYATTYVCSGYVLKYGPYCTILDIDACGIATHTEIIERALANYDNPGFGPGEILRILKDHQGSFQAGAPYPDTFYNTLCQNGDFHNVAEDIHWGEYQRVAWTYFR